MPTRGRQDMMERTLRLWDDQSWDEKQLVIVDDADDPSFPDGVSGIGFRYVRVPQGMTIGAKRNRAVSKADGEVVLHWDSDDWYAWDRIEHQVAHLLQNPGIDLTGYHSMMFERLATGERYFFQGYPGRPIGTSLCYWRKTWEARQFPEQNIQEDVLFASARKVHTEPDDGRIVASIHPGNTSIRDTSQWSRVA